MSGGDRAEFLDIWQQHVTRPGSEKLLDWLDKKTDFFTAPASTVKGKKAGNSVLYCVRGALV